MPILGICFRSLAQAYWEKIRKELRSLSFVEHEENRHHETNEGSQVVPAEVVLENNDGEERKHRKRDALLDDLELNETKRAAVAFKPDAVGRYHEAVFKESDCPGKKHDGVDRPCTEVDDLHGLELQVQVPSAGHENVGNAKKADSQKTFAEHRNLGTNRQKKWADHMIGLQKADSRTKGLQGKVSVRLKS